MISFTWALKDMQIVADLTDKAEFSLPITRRRSRSWSSDATRRIKRPTRAEVDGDVALRVTAPTRSIAAQRQIHRRDAAVDEQVGAVDERGILAHQEQHRLRRPLAAGPALRPCSAPDREGSNSSLPTGEPILFGTMAFTPILMGRELRRHGAGQVRRLRPWRRNRRPARAAPHEARGRADIDDPAAACPAPPSAGRRACPSRNWLLSVTASTRSHSSSVMSKMCLLSEIATLFTRISMRPKRRDHGLDQRGDVAPLGDVGREQLGLAARPPDRCRDAARRAAGPGRRPRPWRPRRRTARRFPRRYCGRRRSRSPPDP